MNFDNYEGVPKYKKKASKKAPAKSNHKHDYSEEVLVHTISTNRDVSWYSLGKRCKICGKTKIVRGFFTKPAGPASLVMLENSEVLAMYKGLPIVERTR